MHRRGGTSQIVDLVHLDIERKRHIVPHQFEARILQQMPDIATPPGEEVIDAQHFIAALKQPFAQMRADEAGTTGNEDASTEEVFLSQIKPLLVYMLLPFNIEISISE